MIANDYFYFVQFLSKFVTFFLIHSVDSNSSPTVAKVGKEQSC